jgi:DNA-binding phage protein
MYFDNRKLLAQMVLRNVKTEDVAKELGINPATFYRKLNKDGEFTRSEIQKLIEFLNIEKPMDIFFATGDA